MSWMRYPGAGVLGLLGFAGFCWVLLGFAGFAGFTCASSSYNKSDQIYVWALKMF